MEELTERIELYLAKQLSTEDARLFEEEMRRDEVLPRKVKLQQKATELLEASAWLTTKEKVKQLNQNDSKTKKKGLWFRVAAIFIGIIVLGTFLNNRLSDQNLYDKYALVYPDRISVMGEEQKSITQVMEYYNQGEYELALELFRDLRESENGSDLLVVYESISLQKSGRAIESIELIESYQQKGQLLEEVIAWNLIMSYLEVKKGNIAYELLLEYESKGYSYQNESAKLLKDDLESFWRLAY